MIHLPDCEMASPICAGNGERGHRGFMFCLHCHRRCICPALRACEQRVREEWYEAQSEAWDQGYMYGLRKAVQIIKDQPTKRQEYWVYIRRNETLAAIDALREEPPIANT